MVGGEGESKTQNCEEVCKELHAENVIKLTRLLFVLKELELKKKKHFWGTLNQFLNSEVIWDLNPNGAQLERGKSKHTHRKLIVPTYLLN